MDHAEHRARRPRRRSMTHDTPPKRAVSVVEFARLFGVSRSTAYELVLSGAIRSLKIGARRVIPLSAIDEWERTASDRSP